MPSQVLSKAQDDKIIKARMWLFTHHPFFAQLAMYLDPRLDEQCPTMGVEANGTLWCNPKFLDDATVDDLVFVICHEVTVHSHSVTAL